MASSRAPRPNPSGSVAQRRGDRLVLADHEQSPRPDLHAVIRAELAAPLLHLQVHLRWHLVKKNTL
jgi:hypothetical protein